MPHRRKKKGLSAEEKKYEEAIARFRDASARHVLVMEAEAAEDDRRKLCAYSERLRLLSNEITGVMQKRISQMQRTKKYRGARKEYGAVSEALKGAAEGSERAAVLKDRLSILKEELEGIAAQYGVTWETCRLLSQALHEKYAVDSVPALTAAEDVWRGVEKVLYKGSDRLHFHKYGASPPYGRSRSAGVSSCTMTGMAGCTSLSAG